MHSGSYYRGSLQHLLILKKKGSLGDGARAFVTGLANGSEFGH